MSGRYSVVTQQMRNRIQIVLFRLRKLNLISWVKNSMVSENETVYDRNLLQF